jgi:hypothetical protein
MPSDKACMKRLTILVILHYKTAVPCNTRVLRFFVPTGLPLELMLTICSGILIYLVAMLPEEEFIKQVLRDFAFIKVGKKHVNREVLSEN